LGTAAKTEVPAALTVNVRWSLLPNLTVVAPDSPLPEIVTSAPTGPLAGLYPVMAGRASTVKFVVVVAMPPGLVTVIGPDDAVAGTEAMILFPLKLNVALLPLNATAVTVPRFLP
jgi:hypothetical protein